MSKVFISFQFLFSILSNAELKQLHLLNYSMIENAQQEHFYYPKVSPLQFLRQQSRAHQQSLKHQKRRIKKKGNLAAHINMNDNIFQLGPERINKKTAQNLLWEKNYNLKVAINALKEDNSSLKAKLWNFEKENRKMYRQIQSWNLEKLFATSRKKPYIDMATVTKVFGDQDYEIVSNKITISQLEALLTEKQHQIEEIGNIGRQEKKYLNKKAYQIGQQKYTLTKCMKQQMNRNNETQDYFENEYLSKRQQQLMRRIGENNEKCEIIKKKNEIKKKANERHVSEYQGFVNEISNYMNVNQEQISKMKQMMRKMRIQEQQNVKDLKKELKGVQQLVMGKECEIQNMMGVFIKKKIELHDKIEDIKQRIEDEQLVNNEF